MLLFVAAVCGLFLLCNFCLCFDTHQSNDLAWFPHLHLYLHVCLHVCSPPAIRLHLLMATSWASRAHTPISFLCGSQTLHETRCDSQSYITITFACTVLQGGTNHMIVQHLLYEFTSWSVGSGCFICIWRNHPVPRPRHFFSAPLPSAAHSSLSIPPYAKNQTAKTYSPPTHSTQNPATLPASHAPAFS